ncbi:hypothetical protein [Amycolatopsis cihanbeyliensis]|uniref:Alpha/beta hydrolase family protein n=1 Tax=Amycolatopsis cihanbeyliensis TaxID=1128664 RepID=A0A542DFM1_AMYCI|nr:hypothetical protein [Amycolatopsis cihanbeyliensis]TQJ01870.1 hypothetical protein FB471_1586 [Amycolatopsis cihanbeyliensis]
MTADAQPDRPRAEGPAVVIEGPDGGPTILVLDPGGAAKHAELPATWRELAERRQVAWCRLPADGSLTDAEELLSDAGQLGSPVDMVTSGPATGTVLDLAGRHPGNVRALLLVDPPVESSADAEARALAVRFQELDRAGVAVETVARSPGGPRDRVEPPLPLGHPDVADAVDRVVAALDWRP